MLRGVLSFLIASVALLAGRASAQSIYSTLATVANTSFFYSALADANLATQFSNSSLNLTLLVPSDAAFTALETQINITGDLFFLPTTAPKAAPILLYHFITPGIPTSAIPSNISSLSLAYSSGTFKVNNSVISTNTTLGAGNFTLVNSTVIKVTGIGSDANITSTVNITAGGSWIHVIDAVLLPFYTTIGSGFSRNSLLSPLNKVVTVQLNNTAFLNVLNNIASSYTVFAPVNTAFNNPDAAVNATLTKLLNSTVGTSYFLNYHLIPSQVFLSPSSFFNATQNQTVTKVTTAAGLQLTLVKEGSTVTLVSPNGNATITASYNVSLTNSGSYRSAIHLISQALVPPTNPTVRSVLELRSDTKTFVSVLGNSSYASWLDSTTLTKGTVFAPTDAAFNTLLATYNYTLAHFLAGQAGVQQILDLLIIQKTTVSVAGLSNGITNITVKDDGSVALRANKSSSSGAVKLLSQSLAASGSSANVIGTDYFVGAVGSGATVIVIDTVLLPLVFNMGSGGAAWMAMPSPLVVLLSSLAAVIALQLFSRQDQS